MMVRNEQVACESVTMDSQADAVRMVHPLIH